MSLGLKYKWPRLWLIHTVAYYGAVKNYTDDLFIDRKIFLLLFKRRLQNSMYGIMPFLKNKYISIYSLAFTYIYICMCGNYK